MRGRRHVTLPRNIRPFSMRAPRVRTIFSRESTACAALGRWHASCSCFAPNSGGKGASRAGPDVSRVGGSLHKKAGDSIARRVCGSPRFAFMARTPNGMRCPAGPVAYPRKATVSPALSGVRAFFVGVPVLPTRGVNASMGRVGHVEDQDDGPVRFAVVMVLAFRDDERLLLAGRPREKARRLPSAGTRWEAGQETLPASRAVRAFRFCERPLLSIRYRAECCSCFPPHQRCAQVAKSDGSATLAHRRSRTPTKKSRHRRGRSRLMHRRAA